ncbi:hypothetical protein WMF27_34575 [Sorangium sp. So ce281]|uniref:hypothetical protein n=1 Tax=unclassified Sorangium TaxID=2621164 RepID=UPI003F631B5B
MKQAARATGAARGGAAKPLPELKVDRTQFGKKVGKHAADFGLNPAKAEHRQWVRDRIDAIVHKYDEVRQGHEIPRVAEETIFLFLLGKAPTWWSPNCPAIL